MSDLKKPFMADWAYFWKDVSDTLAAASFQLSVYENLSYEDMVVTTEVEKARSRAGLGEEEEPEDFFRGLENGDDFYSDIGDTSDQDSYEDPVESFMSSLEP
jgi:hypothetical protein